MSVATVPFKGVNDGSGYGMVVLAVPRLSVLTTLLVRALPVPLGFFTSNNIVYAWLFPPLTRLRVRIAVPPHPSGTLGLTVRV